MNEAKGYSWLNTSADRLITRGPSELIYAVVTANANNADCTIYNGQNTNGDKVIKLISVKNASQPFGNGIAVYCEKGIYVDVGSGVDNVFIMWRDLDPNIGRE